MNGHYHSGHHRNGHHKKEERTAVFPKPGHAQKEKMENDN